MSPSETAILFPGQGVGSRSCRDLVAAERPDLLELARELVGVDPFARMDEGTRLAQPALYCASIASFERLGRPAPACFAGHSLGEVAALAAADAIDDRDGLRAAAARGEAMEAAARSQPPGAMFAVRAERREAHALARGQGLDVVNENAPRQYVLSGPEAGIEAAAARARREGIKAKRLPVAAAFHTEAMAPAVAPFRAALETIEIAEPEVPVISCTTGEPFAARIAESLAAAVALPVHWVDVVRRLDGLGVRRYVDVGPGRVLAGLVARTIHGAEVDAAWEEPVHA